jgi:hypothetical protein
MGLSETILAAMIGAVATVSGALFQIFTAFKAKNRIDPRPRKGSTMRSILAVLALMIASAAGGFLYSEFLKERTGEDMRAMRQELKELTALIAQGKDQAKVAAAAANTPEAKADASPINLDGQGALDTVESVVYVPACRRNDVAAACGEGDAQRIALCGTVPSYSRVDRIDLFVQPDAVQRPWEQHRVAFEQDLGGARFTGKSFEYAQGEELKAVCVNFMHWSSEHPHIARILVQYGFGDAPAPSLTPVSAPEATLGGSAPAVVAADTSPAIPHPATYTAPAATP